MHCLYEICLKIEPQLKNRLYYCPRPPVYILLLAAQHVRQLVFTHKLGQRQYIYSYYGGSKQTGRHLMINMPRPAPSLLRVGMQL
jgi:hypothetical protein